MNQEDIELNELINLYRFKVLEKLINMYTVETGKKPNYKNDNDEYELINFIKTSLKSLKLLYKENSIPIFEIPDKFIEKFFNCLFIE